MSEKLTFTEYAKIQEELDDHSVPDLDGMRMIIASIERQIAERNANDPVYQAIEAQRLQDWEDYLYTEEHGGFIQDLRDKRNGVK